MRCYGCDVEIKEGERSFRIKIEGNGKKEFCRECYLKLMREKYGR